MNAEITVHRQISASLKLFLDELDYKSVWEFVDENHDKLIVLKQADSKFIKAVIKEIDTTGFIPYHYSVEPSKRGKIEKGEKLEVVAELKSKRIFRNVSGDFMLVLFETDKANFLWKSYKLDRDLEVGQSYLISGRFVCPLTGFKREKINLINYVRIKSVEENTSTNS